MQACSIIQRTEAVGLISICLIGQGISSGPPQPLSPCLSMSNYVSVSPALTGRKVLTANPQWWLGAVWGRGKALTSVTAFSAACYKSVTPDKMGTWIRHGTERPPPCACLCACLSGSYLSYVCRCSDGLFFLSLFSIFQPFVIRLNAAVIF